MWIYLLWMPINFKLYLRNILCIVAYVSIVFMYMAFLSKRYSAVWSDRASDARRWTGRARTMKTNWQSSLTFNFSSLVLYPLMSSSVFKCFTNKRNSFIELAFFSSTTMLMRLLFFNLNDKPFNTHFIMLTCFNRFSSKSGANLNASTRCALQIVLENLNLRCGT